MPTLTYPICDSIKTWAQERADAECADIIPAYGIDRRLPNTLEKGIDPLFVRSRHKDVPAKYLARLPDVKLFGADGMLILPSDCFALEWAFSRDQLEAHPDATREPTQRVERKAGNYYSLFWIYWHNYGHWLHECLMRLYSVIDLLPPDTQFIVPAALQPSWQDALQAFGIPRSRQVPFSGETTWQLESLYFTSHTKRASYDLPAEVDWFRTRMWQGCGIARSAQGKRVYVGRRKARWRRIVNDAEVDKFLRGYGFESYDLEGLPFCDQVALFANAQVAVMCHGAGVFNILFAPPQSTLIEVNTPQFVRNDMWAACDAGQVNYWYMFGEQASSDPPSLADIYVPIKKLEQVVTAVLERSPA